MSTPFATPGQVSDESYMYLNSHSLIANVGTKLVQLSLGAKTNTPS